MSKNIIKNNNNRADGGPPLIKKVVHQKVSVQKQSELKLETVNGLEDCFTVCTCSGNITITYVFHHPVGITDLDKDGWVCTLASNMPFLLERIKDPDQENINKKRAQARLNFLIEKGVLALNNGKHYYILHDKSKYSISREDALNNAQDAMDKAKAKEKADLNQKFPGKEQENNKIVNQRFKRDDFLKESEAEFESFIRDVYTGEECMKYVENKVPQNFKTRGGPFANEPQRLCPILKDIKNRAQAIDLINKSFNAMFIKPPE